MKITDITTKISGIYKINFPNNKIYIGRSVDIKRRIKEHYIKKIILYVKKHCSIILKDHLKLNLKFFLFKKNKI
jgi:predicted GIY-YIG superfamily endonuclease